MSAEVSHASQPQQENRRQSWSEYGKEWAVYGKEKYNEQYENWMPWIEDMYLRWFTKDNKTSYTVKGTFRRSMHAVNPPCYPPEIFHFVFNLYQCDKLELRVFV